MLSPVHDIPRLPKPFRDCELSSSPSGVSTSPESPAAAACVQSEAAGAGSKIHGSGGLFGGRSEIERDIAVHTLDPAGRDVLGNHVDEAADRVRAVQQRRRAADDVDARRGGGIDRHAVIARLAGQVAHALAVLQDLHTVAVEAANHRPRRRRAEAAGRDARLALERRAERHFELLRQFLTVEHRRRLVHLELAAQVAGDGRLFLEVQLRIDCHVELRRGVAATVTSVRRVE